MAKKRKGPAPAAENVQAEQSLPVLELKIVARPFYKDAQKDWRDVYLQEVGDGGAREMVMCHLSCPGPRIRRLVFLAAVLGATEVYDPPDNCAPDWKWPEEVPAPAPKLTPSF